MVAIDTCERYPYRFANRDVGTERVALGPGTTRSSPRAIP